MNFYIQASNPYILSRTNVYDSKLSEAIESIFPMDTEELILFWNHVGVSLSYKYDISYMIEDILIILKHLQVQENGELLIHWLPDTFRADWQFEWQGETVIIHANWERLKGDLQKILINSKKIEILKKDFISEWKMLLKILIHALSKNGYDRLIKKQYNILVKNFNQIEEYGILYRNGRCSQ